MQVSQRKAWGKFVCQTTYLLLIICSLLFTGCDLFTKPKDPDFIKKIDEEIRWSNAKSVAVTVAYPQEWGSSPQSGTGRCFDNKRTNQTPRTGYSFNVQFDSNPAYGEAQWRAYKRSDLPSGSDWYINSLSISETLDELDRSGKRLNESQIVFSPAQSYQSTVTSNIGDALVIIPYCDLQPRIVKSSPPLDADSSSHARAPNKEISVTFAAPVDAATFKFAKDFIEITGSNADITNFFSQPVYNPDTYTLTLQSAGIPSGIVIEIRLGKEIKSQGGEKGMAEKVFSYRTTDAALAVHEWEALYNYNNNRIELEWKLPAEAQDMRPALKYSINGGIFTAAYPRTNESFWIENVPRIQDSMVTSGIAAEGFYAYTVILDLGEEPTMVCIWNIPGMKVNQDTEIIALTESNFRTALQANSAYYVLTEDIAINGEWAPIGRFVNIGPSDYDTASDPDYLFRGKFYGNGHTITFNGNFTPSPYCGIFGKVKDAEIRDLSIIYGKDTLISGTPGGEWIVLGGASGPEFSAGGLAGSLENTIIANVITRAHSENIMLSVTPSDYVISKLGGIAGYANGGTIRNCYAGLSVSFNRVIESNAVLIGAIAGETGSGLVIENINISANVSAALSENAIWAYIGGAVGMSLETTLKNISFINGTVSLNRDGFSFVAFSHFGGFIGDAGGIIGEHCSFNGKMEIAINMTVESINHDSIGGFIGQLSSLEDDIHPTNLNNCRINGDLTLNHVIQGDSRPALSMGGFAGRLNLEDNSTLIMNECFFEDGNISVRAAGTVYVGGFVEDIMSSFTGYSSIRNCGSLGGRMHIEAEGYIGVGGFSRYNTGSIFCCYAKADMFVKGGNYMDVGGFTGMNIGVIESCYAAGTVRIISDDRDILGGLGGAREINAGGFAGSNSAGEIKNSYALGDIFVDKTAGDATVYAGGIVGNNFNSNDTGTIRNCFTVGRIAAQSKESPVYAGGIAGYHQVFNYSMSNPVQIENNAALGEKIIAASNATNMASRVLGSYLYTTGYKINNNFAIDAMMTGSSDTGPGAYIDNLDIFNKDSKAIIDSFPGSIPASNIGLTQVNGQHAAVDDILNPNFWIQTLLFNRDGEDSGLGSVTNTWNFDGVHGRGYPLLSWE